MEKSRAAPAQADPGKTLAKGTIQRILGGSAMLAGIAAGAIMIQTYVHNISTVPVIKDGIVTSNTELFFTSAPPLIVSGSILETIALPFREAPPLFLAASGFVLLRMGNENVRLMRRR